MTSLKMISWNIATRADAWRQLADSNVDIALLQEATDPPDEVRDRLIANPGSWHTAGAGQARPWRAALVDVSRRVKVEWLTAKPIELAHPYDLAVSRPGTLAAAILAPESVNAITVVSVYAPWEKPHQSTESGWIYADSSVHRLISDISALIGQQTRHRLIVAGDLNVLYGYGEERSVYWKHRYATVFDRFAALGLTFVGPLSPLGRQADPWPLELPLGSKNVPTYHSNRTNPGTATRQRDFVFASASLADALHVRAVNEPDQWGPSDHCRIEIEVSLAPE